METPRKVYSKNRYRTANAKAKSTIFRFFRSLSSVKGRCLRNMFWMPSVLAHLVLFPFSCSVAEGPLAFSAYFRSFLFYVFIQFICHSILSFENEIFHGRAKTHVENTKEWELIHIFLLQPHVFGCRTSNQTKSSGSEWNSVETERFFSHFDLAVAIRSTSFICCMEMPFAYRMHVRFFVWQLLTIRQFDFATQNDGHGRCGFE